MLGHTGHFDDETIVLRPTSSAFIDVTGLWHQRLVYKCLELTLIICLEMKSISPFPIPPLPFVAETADGRAY